ncbi:hypothetical protein K8T06_05785, partial [bacterium]|nr:hypothetical protein [bacterium]
EQDIGWVMVEAGSSEMTRWYNETLLAEYIEDNSGCLTVSGFGADFDGLNFSIIGGSGANNQDYPSLIEPLSPAETCFTYDEYSGPNTGTAGIRADRNGAKHIYLAFGFEGISTQIDRADAMDSMMTWFGIEKIPGMCPFNQSPGFWIGPEIPIAATYTSSAFCESNMQIYQAGGFGGDGKHVDPSVFAIDTATHLSSDTGADLSGGRYYHRTACLDDHGREKIFFFGGIGETGTIKTKVEVFDPVTGIVTELTLDPLPEEIDGIPGNATVAGNKFYLIGMARMSAPFQDGRTWVFDPMAPDGSKWSLFDDILDEPRFFAATAVLDGKIYLMGGISQITATEIRAFQKVSVLDTNIASPVWDDNAVEPLPRAIFFNAGIAVPHGANVDHAGKILVCGGMGAAQENIAELYDPVTNTWTETWPLQNQRILTGSIHLVPKPRGASIWVLGGHFGEIYSNTEIYYLGDDPTDSWVGIRTYPETVMPGCSLRVGLDIAGDKAVTSVDCYIAMEVSGAWFFITAEPVFPTFTEQPIPFFANAPLPEDLTYCGPLFEIPLPTDMPAFIGTFYAASLVSGTGDFAGGFASASFIVP